jgi:hypothetical protein
MFHHTIDFNEGDPIKLYSEYQVDIDGKKHHVTWNFKPQGNNDKTGPLDVNDKAKIKVVGHNKVVNGDGTTLMEYYVVNVIDGNGKIHKTQPGTNTPLHITLYVNKDMGIKPFMTGVDAKKGEWKKIDGPEFEAHGNIVYGRYSKRYDQTLSKNDTILSDETMKLIEKAKQIEKEC